jgi:hypothetical protein
MGREHSVTSECFQEAKPQGPLSGNELGKVVVVSRPSAVLRVFTAEVRTRPFAAAQISL